MNKSRGLTLRSGAKYFAGPILIAGVAFFFYRAFQRNWANIQAQHVEFVPLYLGLAVLCMLVTYLVPTWGWQDTINTLARGSGRLSFRETVAVVNSANLVKYVPGKVLTYALQLYWLSKRGFSKTLVLYVNVLNLLVSLAVSLLLTALCLWFMPEVLSPRITACLVVGGLLLDVIGFRFHTALLRFLIRTFNRVFHRDIPYLDVPGALLFRLHLVHLTSASAFALSAYLTARGIGCYVPLSGAPRLMAAILASDTIAFFAVITPGGLGVREALMYLVLGGAGGTALAITLPIATRAVNMAVDLLLGGVAFKLLGRLTRPLAADAAAGLSLDREDLP